MTVVARTVCPFWVANQVLYIYTCIFNSSVLSMVPGYGVTIGLIYISVDIMCYMTFVSSGTNWKLYQSLFILIVNSPFFIIGINISRCWSRENVINFSNIKLRIRVERFFVWKIIIFNNTRMNAFMKKYSDFYYLKNIWQLFFILFYFIHLKNKWVNK